MMKNVMENQGKLCRRGSKISLIFPPLQPWLIIVFLFELLIIESSPFAAVDSKDFAFNISENSLPVTFSTYIVRFKSLC